jgi:hypothetical protein
MAIHHEMLANIFEIGPSIAIYGFQLFAASKEVIIYPDEMSP